MAVLLAVEALVAGCGGGRQPAADKRVPHIKALAVLYFKAVSKLGRRPESEPEFKQAIAQGELDLGALGVSNVEELFISERDNQPLVILYGGSPKGASPGVVAYERTGKDGKRLVATNTGQVIEADDAQFAKLVPSPQP
jgi:hypothetical protein